MEQSEAAQLQRVKVPRGFSRSSEVGGASLCVAVVSKCQDECYEPHARKPVSMSRLAAGAALE